MINRRTFLAVVAGGIAAPGMTSAQPRKVSLYANVGPDLTHYEVDVEGAALTAPASARMK